jgi:hypothetical protein
MNAVWHELRSSRAGVLLFVLLGHGAWLLWWAAGPHHLPVQPIEGAVTILNLRPRLVEKPTPRILPDAPSARQRPAAIAISKVPTAARRARSDTPVPALVWGAEQTVPTTVDVPPAEDARATVAAPASAAQPSNLLDTQASRRAIRDVARELSLQERTALASSKPRDLLPEERLGQEIARAGRGDCLKGEFFGGGGGLLSLPFWLIAEMRDKCRR